MQFASLWVCVFLYVLSEKGVCVCGGGDKGVCGKRDRVRVCGGRDRAVEEETGVCVGVYVCREGVVMYGERDGICRLKGLPSSMRDG